MQAAGLELFDPRLPRRPAPNEQVLTVLRARTTDHPRRGVGAAQSPIFSAARRELPAQFDSCTNALDSAADPSRFTLSRPDLPVGGHASSRRSYRPGSRSGPPIGAYPAALLSKTIALEGCMNTDQRFVSSAALAARPGVPRFDLSPGDHPESRDTSCASPPPSVC